MNVHDKKFLFIGGLHRSGTSLLYECITQHPSISGFSDTGVPEDEGQHLQTVYPPARAHGRVGEFGFDTTSYLDEDSELATQDNMHRLVDEWSKHWNMEKPILAEKSPPNLVRTRFLQSLFPNSLFIIILRHPIPVALATRKWNPTRVDKLIKHWIVCHNRFLSDAGHINNIKVIKYEDFVTKNRYIMRSIFQFIGIESIDIDTNIIDDINSKYFSEWGRRPMLNFNVPIIKHVYRRYCDTIFEKDVSRFGYSLKDLALTRPIANLQQ